MMKRFLTLQAMRPILLLAAIVALGIAPFQTDPPWAFTFGAIFGVAVSCAEILPRLISIKRELRDLKMLMQAIELGLAKIEDGKVLVKPTDEWPDRPAECIAKHERGK